MGQFDNQEIEKLLEQHKNGAVVADLSGQNLSGLDFSDHYLEQVNFSEAILHGCNFEGADLRIANLSGADLRRSNLTNANLTCANLAGADLTQAFLTRTVLLEASLVGCRLIEVDFKWSDLRESTLDGACITGSNFYLSAFDSWSIEGVTCEYVFWDQAGEKRNPIERNFRDGEFVSLHRSLPTIEYYFENGFTPIDVAIIERTVLEITESNPEFHLEIDSYHIKGAIPRMKLTVESTEHKDRAYSLLRGRYEELSEIYRLQSDSYAALTQEIIKNMSGNTFNIKGNVVGNVGDNNSINDNAKNALVISNAQVQKLLDSLPSEEETESSTAIPTIRDELKKLPTKGIKALSDGTMDWLKKNSVKLIQAGGSEVRELLEAITL